ncbi:MAG TPA: aminopeptidase [Clostridiales bacterium]|nr:M20/M25/M40 family metallo-hydrolase [Clostridia bacterium]MDD4681237.1 M20/M25/M40 family metallo-hydrolase [Clostridia bacterium]HCS75140.1 aminopeptidase [Clostridiales bacterium]
MREFLAELMEIPGVSGYEEQTANRVADEFSRYCDEVRTDSFFNVYGIKKGTAVKEDYIRPKVMLAAHMDEIALMVRDIDEKGFLRFTSIGGVDQRILPAQEVSVHGRKKLHGIICTLPPHLQEAGESQKVMKMKDMCIDLGMPADKVKELVRVGDLITFISPLVSMQGSLVNGKSLDDRASVVLLVEVMKELDRLQYQAEVVCVATVQEEVGTRGAIISSYSTEPDIGIAIDVTHGETPDASKEDTHPMDKGVVVCKGPNMHPGLTDKFLDVAKEFGMECLIEIEPRPTGTDARSIQISRSGVPTILLAIPLRYMHTTVETMNMEHIKSGARLIALFIASLKEGWQEWLKY